MKSILFTVLCAFLIGACQQGKDNYLLKIHEGSYDEIGVASGYTNLQGDTVIPIGKYYYCLTDTFRNFAIVMQEQVGWIGIDRRENKLFEIYVYDNGPDYVTEGLFKIKKNGKIVIEPQFTCAFPFENGRAKVAYACTEVSDGEHSVWESNNWLYVDKKGNKVE